MIYKKDYFGYVYEWTNIVNGKKYIGSHYGSVEDSYIGSGKEFKKEYLKSPDTFIMKVLEYIIVDDKKLVLEKEKNWLDSVPNIKDDPMYYNLNNDAAGGFGYITHEHVIKRAATLKKKHFEKGLSDNEKRSYKQKIQTRLDRIKSSGFTEKEKEQHAKYGYKIQVELPSGETRIYDSCSKASKDLGIDTLYGLQVCAKKLEYKGHKIVKLEDPIVSCNKKGNQ